MSSATLPAVMNGPSAPAVPAPIVRGVEPVVHAIDALKAIRTFVQSELIEGTDFGVIPGTGDKPTLLKPGAEKIALYYQTRIAYTIDRAELGNGHLEVNVRCDLLSRQSGAIAAEGHGSCSTMESKYRWRSQGRACPSCGASAISRSKYPPRGRPKTDPGGWWCNPKNGGCGADFDHDNPDVTGQQTGRVENQDVWDARNTVLKMALKRALVSAVLSLGSLSERFTQDVEDLYDLPPVTGQKPAQEVAAPAKPERPPAAGPAAEGRKREQRPIAQLVQDGCAKTADLLRQQFPDLDPKRMPNAFQVMRHLYRFVTGQESTGVDNVGVRKAVEGAYGTEARQKIQRELIAYLDEQAAEVRREAIGEVFDRGAGDDQADPDVDYPDGVTDEAEELEPGSRG